MFLKQQYGRNGKMMHDTLVLKGRGGVFRHEYSSSFSNRTSLVTNVVMPPSWTIIRMQLPVQARVWC